MLTLQSDVDNLMTFGGASEYSQNNKGMRKVG